MALDVDALPDALSRALLQNMPNAGMFVADRDLRITMFEGAVFRQAGWGEDAVGRTLEELSPAEAYAEAEPHYRAALAGETRSFRRAGSNDRVYQAVVSPVMRTTALLPDGLFVAVVDVTDQANAEGRLRDVEATLQAGLRDETVRLSEERLGLIFHQSPVAMALLDFAPEHAGTIVDANHAFAALVGRPLDEVIGADVNTFTHPEDRERLHQAREAVAGGAEQHALIKRYVRPDGTIRIGEIRAGPIRDETGTVRYGLGTIVDVTDHMQSEDARRTIIDASLDGIVSIDGDGLITVFNAAAERIFGHRCDAVLGKPMAHVLIPPESRGKHLAGVRRIHEAPEELAPTTIKVTGMHADGSRIPIEVTVRRTATHPPEFTAFVRDLSEHTRAQRRQRDAEQLFESVFADSAVAMAVQNVNGRMVEVNDELCRFLARPREELLGADPADFNHAADRVAHDEIFATLIGGAEGIRSEKRFLRPDGTVVWAFVHASLIRDESGRPRGIQKQLVDITARQRAKAQLEAVLNSLAEGVIALDSDRRVVGVNPAAEYMLGHTERDLLGRQWEDVVRPRDETHACAVAEVAGDGVLRRVDDDLFRRADGSLLPVSYSASPLEAGEQRGVVVVFSDISERKAREHVLNRRLEAFDVIEQIRSAMRDDRLVLHTQPILDLATDEIHQEELLLRMVGEDGALVPPGAFLPVAEEYGLIADIDRWVIGRAAEIAATGRHVEVNVSGVTLGNRDLVYWVEEALATSGADPRNITFEITETALTNDLEQASRFAEHVATLGCGFALDDFGTGYGSFTLLKRLPISYLKIDMEFVSTIAEDEADRHVVGAVISLAKGLGMRTIAEGVETPEVLAILREMGVDFAQGYLIGRPGPLDA